MGGSLSIGGYEPEKNRKKKETLGYVCFSFCCSDYRKEQSFMVRLSKLELLKLL